MRKHAILIYIGVVALAAIFVSSALDWSSMLQLPAQHLVGLIALIGLGVLSEYLSIPLVVGKNQSSHSIVFILLFASVLVLGPAATTLVALFSFGIGEFVITRNDSRRAFFNVAQHTLATATAGLVFAALGGIALADQLTRSFLPFLAFAVTVNLLNLLAVSIVVSLDQGLPVARVAARLSGKWGANLGYDLLITPLAVLIAFSYVQYGTWGLLGFSFLLLWVRRSYVVSFQLQQANRDLLKALVKAIETRDPYTSGHSLRVASLASDVAGRLGLPEKRIEHVETAALLHDVGKIDAIYTDILKKRSGLSAAELEIIKSHVDKGVDLLTSLSSFHSDVISAVRHHHERYDGSGYPDGLAGPAIPLGARIIKICDAVDAMLSDRPYRKALSLPEVREQLMLFAEREFDPQLVAVFFREGLLESHAVSVSGVIEEPHFAHADPEHQPVRLTLTG